MNDRQRLNAIIDVINKYLPPDGIDVKSAMTEIIALVDPLPEDNDFPLGKACDLSGEGNCEARQ